MIAVDIVCIGIVQNMFFLVVYFFCLLDSKLDTVPLLETNIIPALGGEINICVQLHIHIGVEKEVL